MEKNVFKRKTCFLIIFVLCEECLNSNQILAEGHIQEPKWSSEARFRAAASNKRSLGQVDLFMPISQNDSSLLFLDLRFWRDTKQNTEGNYGLAYRKLVSSLGWIFGGYGFFDNRLTKNNNSFQQITLGVEALSEIWDFRTNVYAPFSKAQLISGEQSQLKFRGHGEYTSISEEVALKGIDVEVGCLIPYTENVRLYAGEYFFQGHKAPHVNGVRARLEWRVNSYFYVEGDYQYDKVRGNIPSIWLTLRVPFGEESYKKLNSLEKRMSDVIIRDIDIVTCPRKVEIPTPRHFIHAIPGGKGKKDGTFESPADSNNLEKIQVLLGEHPTYIYRGPKPVENLKKPVQIKDPLPPQDKKDPVVPPVEEVNTPPVPVTPQLPAEEVPVLAPPPPASVALEPPAEEVNSNKEENKPERSQVKEMKEEPVKKVKQRIRMWLSSPQSIPNEMSILPVENPQSLYFHRHETTLPSSQVAESIVLELLNAFNQEDMSEQNKQDIIDYINLNHQRIVSALVFENINSQTPQEMKEVPNPQSHYVEKIPAIKPGKLITQAHVGEVTLNGQGVNTAPKPPLGQFAEAETTPIHSFRPIIREKVDTLNEMVEKSTDSRKKQPIRRTLNFNEGVSNSQVNFLLENNSQNENFALSFPLEQHENTNSLNSQGLESVVNESGENGVFGSVNTEEQSVSTNLSIREENENPLGISSDLTSPTTLRTIKGQNSSVPQKSSKQHVQTPNSTHLQVEGTTSLHSLESAVKPIDFVEPKENVAFDSEIIEIDRSNTQDQIITTDPSVKIENESPNSSEQRQEIKKPISPLNTARVLNFDQDEEEIDSNLLNIQNHEQNVSNPLSNKEIQVVSTNSSPREANGNLSDRGIDLTSPTTPIRGEKQEPVQVVFYEETPTKLQENTYSVILKKGDDLDYILNSMLELKEAENSEIVFDLNHLSEDIQEKVTHFVNNNKSSHNVSISESISQNTSRPQKVSKNDSFEGKDSDVYRIELTERDDLEYVSEQIGDLFELTKGNPPRIELYIEKPSYEYQQKLNTIVSKYPTTEILINQSDRLNVYKTSEPHENTLSPFSEFLEDQSIVRFLDFMAEEKQISPLAKQAFVQYIDLNKESLISREIKTPHSEQTLLQLQMTIRKVQKKIETVYQKNMDFIPTGTLDEVKSPYETPLYFQRTKLIPWSPTLSPIIEESSLDFLENEHELSNEEKNSTKKELDFAENNITSLPHKINDPKAEATLIQTHTREEHPNQKDIVVENIENPLPSEVEKVKSLKRSIAPHIERKSAQQQELKLAPTSTLNQVESAYKTPLNPQQAHFVGGVDSPGLSPIVSRDTPHFLDDDEYESQSPAHSSVRKEPVFEESALDESQSPLKAIMPPGEDPSLHEEKRENHPQLHYKAIMGPNENSISNEGTINSSPVHSKALMPLNTSSMNGSDVFEQDRKPQEPSPLWAVFCQDKVTKEVLAEQYKDFEGNFLYFTLEDFLKEHKVPEKLNESGLRHIEILLLNELKKQTEGYPNPNFDLTGLTRDSQEQFAKFMETHYKESEVQRTYFPEHKKEPSRFSAQGFGLSPENKSSEIIDKTPQKYKVDGFNLSSNNESSGKNERTPKNYRTDGFGLSPSNESLEIIDKTPQKYKVDGFNLSSNNESLGDNERTPKNYRTDGFGLSPSNESSETIDKTPKNYRVDGFGFSPNNESSEIIDKTPKNYRVDGFGLSSKNYKTDGFGLPSEKFDTMTEPTTPILETNKQSEPKKGFWRRFFDF